MPKFPQPQLSKFATQVISMLALYPDEFLARDHSSVWHRALGEFKFTRFRGLRHLGRGTVSDGRPLDKTPSDWVSPRHLTRIEQWVLRGHIARWSRRPVDVTAAPATDKSVQQVAQLDPSLFKSATQVRLEREEFERAMQAAQMRQHCMDTMRHAMNRGINQPFL